MIYDLQKASMWKRISAFLFDGILLGIVVVLFAWGLSAALGYDRYNDTLNACYAQYEAEYGVSFHMSLSEYEGMTEEQARNLDAAYQALGANSEAAHAYNMLIQLTLLITSLGILLGYLALEFAVPLFLGNGQTLGKKIFGLGLMRTEGIKINGICLFIRTILGKYTIETMIPVLTLLLIYWGSVGLMGTVILLILLAAQIILIVATHTNSLIHDLLAGTVAVDVASQMIFDTKEALIAYKEKLHAEQVAREPY